MTLRSYILGFILSLVLTFAAYFAVLEHIGGVLVITIILLLALAQLFVQLFYFLHLRHQERGANIVLMFALLVVAILVGGTLWIMSNLSHTEPMLFMDHPSPETQLE
jgi:cytochrome o ubiquinol oxidase operon protein cyoD